MHLKSNIPKKCILISGSVTYVFAIKALDTDGRNVSGPLSNIASASLENLEQVNPEQDNPEEDGLSTSTIIIIGIGVTLAAIMLITAVSVIIYKCTIGGAQSV